MAPREPLHGLVSLFPSLHSKSRDQHHVVSRPNNPFNSSSLFFVSLDPQQIASGLVLLATLHLHLSVALGLDCAKLPKRPSHKHPSIHNPIDADQIPLLLFLHRLVPQPFQKAAWKTPFDEIGDHLVNQTPLLLLDPQHAIRIAEQLPLNFLVGVHIDFRVLRQL